MCFYRSMQTSSCHCSLALLILHLGDNFTFGFLEAPSIKVCAYQRCPCLSEVPETASLKLILLAGHCRPSPSPAPVVLRLRPGSPLFGALQVAVMCVAADFVLRGLLYVPLFSAAVFHLSLLLEKLWFLSHPPAVPLHSVVNVWAFLFVAFFSGALMRPRQPPLGPLLCPSDP